MTPVSYDGTGRSSWVEAVRRQLATSAINSSLKQADFARVCFCTTIGRGSKHRKLWTLQERRQALC